MQIVRFTALWCTSCLLMKSRWKEFFKDYPNIDIIDVDFDDSPDLVEKYQIGTTLPVMIVYNENQIEMKRIVGEKSVKELKRLFQEVIQ